jgi:hypothetical protein
MWNFIKSFYRRIRNFVAATYTTTVAKSMDMAFEADNLKGSKFNSLLMNIASFAIFCVATVGIMALMLGSLALVYVPLFFVVGEVLACVIAVVVTAAFAIDLFETISFFQKLNRIARFGF